MQKMMFCLLLTGIFILTGCGEVRYEVAAPESREMKYLLFPVKSYRETLPRAIIVSGQELHSGDKIAYWVGNTEVWTDKSNFTLLPDGQQIALVDRLNTEIIRWGKETDY